MMQSFMICLFYFLKKIVMHRPYYFDNSLKWFLLNPFYICRSNLYKEIKKCSKYISWDVLDFWCWEKPYKHLMNFDKYIWIDFSKTWHDNSWNNIDIFWNGSNLPFEDSIFDSIISTEVFEHIFNLDLVLNEFHRVLKPGWKILISIPFCMDEHEIPYDFARYTTFGIRDILHKNWFTIINQIKTTNYWQTILQLNRMYIGKLFKTKINYINILLKIIIIFPLHIIINLLSFIIPWNKDFYFNQVIVAKK